MLIVIKPMPVDRIFILCFSTLVIIFFCYIIIRAIIMILKVKKEYKKRNEKRKQIHYLIKLFDENYIFPPGGIDKRIYIKDLKKYLEEKEFEQKYIDYAVNLMIASSITNPESTN